MWILCAVPTIRGFLHIFPLRFGVLVCFIWTLIRSLICTGFFTEAILEVFAQKHCPMGRLLVNSTQVPYPSSTPWYTLYLAYITMLLCQGVIIVSCFYLLAGCLCACLSSLQVFLTTRRYLWLIEIVSLITMCVLDQLLLGWYLLMIMLIVVELYGIMVVYSFYMEEKLKEDCTECDTKVNDCCEDCA